ncbi:MAG: hypothetical protein IKB46_03475 [Paludibacteraceae bacterium]|nr:hypothetical protein [Paludibacteraceae bacterium]
MKKHILLTLCALFALVSNTFAQIQHGDIITISSNNYYLAVNTNNNGITTVSMENANLTKAILWKVQISNNQYSFTSVAASEAGRNAGLVRNSTSLALAATGSAFQFGTNGLVNNIPNETTGRLYFDAGSGSRRYYYINYQSSNWGTGSWNLSRQNNTNYSSNTTLLTLEKWEYKEEKGGLTGAFSSPVLHFELAKNEEEVADQTDTLQFTVTRTPAQTYYYCVPRQGESYSTIKLKTSTPNPDIELDGNPSFIWESNKQAILYAQAGTYDNPEAITNRPCLKVTSEAVADAATPTYNVTLTPIGTSPMNMKDDAGNWIDLTDNLVAVFREKDDPNETKYETKSFILRHSYHKVALPPFVITPTPVSYTFGRNSEDANITFECTHQHGYEVYSPADKLVHTERTLHEQLTLGSAIDRANKTAKAEFSFQNQQDLTAVDWVAQTESSTLANNTLSITAQENTTGMNRQARLVCKVSYECDVNGMYEDNVTIQLRQRAKDGAITLQPNHGYANPVFGKNPYNNADEQQVHTAEQTIYYLAGDEIDLVLPEANFMGYKRWYDYETGSNPVWNLNESDRTTWHVAPAGTNINNSYGDSYGIYSTTNTNTTNPILYGWTDGAAHIMACDVSNYTDYAILYNEAGDIDTIVEPTLSYRQLWHLRPANEMADKFAALAEGEYLEVHNYMAPTNKNIFLVPDYGHNREVLCHNNYFYYAGANKTNIKRIKGNAKWYDETGKDITPRTYNAKDFLSLESNTTGTKTYYLRAEGVLPDGKDLLIAKFVVNFVDINTHGPIAPSSKANALITRKQITEEYILLEEITFNYDPLPKGTAYEPIYHPLPWGESTYGYFYSNGLLGNSDKYHQHDNRKRNPSIPYYGEYFLTNYMNADWAEGAQHGGAQNGYALFVDGTTEPGLVASISTDAKICSGQTMFCTMWLLNPRKSEDGSANPIFRCNIQGRNQDENGVWGEWEEVGVFFVGPVQGAGRGWHQINFPVLSENQSYEETRVSIYNFGMGNNGNDFMVDDICLYASPLPLAAYQATMGCESFTDAANTSTAVVVRMDYSELTIYSADDINQGKKKYAYYQIYNNTDNHIIKLTAPVEKDGEIKYEAAYYNEENIESNNQYGSVAIPIPDYVPTTGNGDNIQTSVREYIDGLIDGSERHGKCFVYDRVTGKYFLYVIHIIPNVDHHSNEGYEEHIAHSHLEKDKDYELRISHDPAELGSADCASTTPLHATQDTYIKLNTEGEEPLRVECIDNVCANDFHMLEVKVQNTFATSVGGSLQTVEANVHADWLWGYDFDDVFCDHLTMTHEQEEAANVAFENEYHCSRADLRAAIAAMRRVPTNDDPNPNYQVDNYRNLQVVKDENDNILFSQEQKDLITRLCQEGLLSLYKTNEMFYLGSEDIARYWVYPVANDASVVINGETYTLHDCDEPKWVKVQSAASEYGVNISPEDFDASKIDPQHLQLPTVRVVQPIAGNTEIAIPIKDITDQTQLYSTLYSGTNLTIDLANPIHEVLEFVDIQYDHIEVAPAPTSWEVGETYLMRMSFYDEQGYAYIGGDEGNCRVGYIYFYVMIVPNTVQWTGAVSAEWGNDDNWVGVHDDGTLMDIGHAPLAETNVIIPALPEDKPYPSVGTTDLYPKDIHYAHNACNDIYFAVGAMLHNQHLLDYNRAFVDMKIQAAQWNAMAPPLNGMYTGDIYVPHEGAYPSGSSVEYTSISGTNGHSDYPFVVHEFAGARALGAPYVFWQSFYNQRATIYHDNGNTSSPALTQEALFAQTNSLSEQLLPGTGFQVLGFGPTHGEGDEIIVRLPKPDNSYDYFDSKGNPSGQSVSVTHSSKLAFNPTDGVMTITLQNDLASRQFMFGNPTMAYVDMAAFLKENENILAPKYYTIDNSTWSAQNLYSIEANGTGLLAPMRSVMLELKEGSSDSRSIQLTLSHEHLKLNTPAPAADDQPANSPARSMAASSDNPQGMTIYATTANGQTQCMLFAAPEATDTYLSHEDVLFVSTGVETANILTTPINMYTVSNQVPMMIDVRQNIDTVPMSMLIHPDYRTEKVEFAFYLTMNWDKECYFYDAVTGERVRIMDGTIIERPLPQNHENRYYIVGPDRTSNGENTETAIPTIHPDNMQVWAYSEQAGNITVCSNDIIQAVTVYDITGRLIAHKALDLLYNQVSLPVGQGVHIAEVTLRDNSKHYTRTIVK